MMFSDDHDKTSHVIALSRLSHKNVVVFSSLCCPVASRTILKVVTFTTSGKRQFVPRDHVFPYLSFTVHDFDKIGSFRSVFIHKNCVGLFLSAY